MKPHTTPPAVVPEPLDWGLSAVEALVLELEYSIDAPWLSDGDSWRSSQEPASRPAREKLQNMWQQQHGLKPCRAFSMGALAEPERKPVRRRDCGWVRWPGARCFDHAQFFVCADTGLPAAVLLEPYHFDPAPYEADRAELEAAGLSFAQHDPVPAFYDPLRTSAMLVVRGDDASAQHLDTAALAASLAEQQQNAWILMGLTALEYVYRTGDADIREFLWLAVSTGQLSHPLHPHRGSVR